MGCRLINHLEGGVRGARKLQNRTEMRQKTANRIGLFPQYRNRTYTDGGPLYELTPGMEIQDVDVSLAKTVNHIKY